MKLTESGIIDSLEDIIPQAIRNEKEYKDTIHKAVKHIASVYGWDEIDDNAEFKAYHSYIADKIFERITPYGDVASGSGIFFNCPPDKRNVHYLLILIYRLNSLNNDLQVEQY